MVARRWEILAAAPICSTMISSTHNTSNKLHIGTVISTILRRVGSFFVISRVIIASFPGHHSQLFNVFQPTDTLGVGLRRRPQALLTLSLFD